jgi:hypothetical protein
MRVPANRASWKIEECSLELIHIPYEDAFSDHEIAQIRLGVIPRSMDEKWFIFFEPPFLFFHRSWTGRLIYRLEIEDEFPGARVKDARVVDDPQFYRRQSDEYEACLVSFLVRRVMLEQDVPFPVPEALRQHVPGLYQHHVVGLGVPEIIMAGTKRPET